MKILTTIKSLMELNPNTIYEEYVNNRLDKITVIKQLISIIENYDDNAIREESIKVLGKVKLISEDLFDLFENLLLSDSSEIIRNAAAIYLSEHHLNDSLAVFKWALQYEKSINCLLTIARTLVKINSKESKTILIEQLKKIRKTQYINLEKGYENKRYKKALKPLIKRNKIANFSHQQLGEILINFFTVKKLIEDIPNVYFELNSANLLVEKLDLSDYLEFEVKGTPWGWKNNLRDLSEISGLKNLKNLKKLDLSNNQIENVKGLVELQNLTHLILSNNQISDADNLEYLKQLSKLQFLDLCGNRIVNFVKKADFNPNTRVLLNRFI
ncbi:MAG: leucine-rich repeat domain-containing protein [Candidatus Lokiarchaeota archaeon]|nr:leucine-rich repeat domain-containing protein [Candidatus Lokiarchaeota archaeon]